MKVERLDPKPLGANARRSPQISGWRSSRSTSLALALVLTLGLQHSAFGISKAPAASATPPTTMPVPATPGMAIPTNPVAPAPDNEAAALAKIVGRLATRQNTGARDWAELGRETVTWGSRVQSQHQPVPEGPVRDALAAVDLGAKLDKTAADWPKLREELEALLKKPEEEKDEDKQQQKQPQQNQQDKNQQQNKDKDQQKQDQEKSEQQQKQDEQDNKDPSDKNQQQNNEQADKQSQPKPQGESAFGDMTKKEEQPPPPPPQSMQKVGGEQKEEKKEPLDPALALPLQKLEQLKNQDSPAQLFQLMEGEKKGPRKTGKDW